MAAEPADSKLLLTISRLQGQGEEQSKLLRGVNSRIDRLYIALRGVRFRPRRQVGDGSD